MLPTPPASPSPDGIITPEDRLGHILAGRLQLTGILGVGAYGVVYTAIDLQTNTPYAVKALSKIGVEPRQQRFQQREIQLHYQASFHPNVVSLVRIMDAPDCTYVIIEYCPEGDLFSNITERGKYVGNDFMAKSVFLQILDAVEFCHSIGIYHRDLKPENILVTDNGMLWLNLLHVPRYDLTRTARDRSPCVSATNSIRMSTNRSQTVRKLRFGSKRCLVARRHTGQSDLWAQSVETSMLRRLYLPGFHAG